MRLLRLAFTLAVAVAAALALAPTAARAQAAAATPLPVESARPARETAPTLRFLKANADFLRARFEKFSPLAHVQGRLAQPVDPRYLSYRGLLAQIAAAKDSVAASAEARERQALFENVSDLADLERELDQMERVLAAQEVRLGALHADFAGRQRTELAVLVTGGALAGRLDSVVVTVEDGSRAVVGLDDAQRRSLKVGGLLEVFRALAEPREQVLEVRFLGEGWNQVAPGFVRVSPARDRLTFVKLDLSQATPVRGFASVTAGMWRLDAPSPSRATADADRDRP